jgi:hypothetical protein
LLFSASTTIFEKKDWSFFKSFSNIIANKVIGAIKKN